MRTCQREIWWGRKQKQKDEGETTALTQIGLVLRFRHLQTRPVELCRRRYELCSEAERFGRPSVNSEFPFRRKALAGDFEATLQLVIMPLTA